MTRAMASLVALCCVVAVGCSGSDDGVSPVTIEALDPSTTPPPTDPPADTTVPEPAESDPTTTVETSTTLTSTTTTTTEPAPTTTTLEDLRREIEEDLNEREQAYLQAAADPSSPNVAELLAKHNSGPVLATVTNLLAEFAANGEVLRENPDVPNRVEVLEVVSSGGGRAEVRICRIDAAVQLVPSTDPAVPDQIVDDRVGRFFSMSGLVFDGVWKLSSGTAGELTIGASTCD